MFERSSCIMTARSFKTKSKNVDVTCIWRDNSKTQSFKKLVIGVNSQPTFYLAEYKVGQY